MDDVNVMMNWNKAGGLDNGTLSTDEYEEKEKH